MRYTREGEGRTRGSTKLFCLSRIKLSPQPPCVIRRASNRRDETTTATPHTHQCLLQKVDRLGRRLGEQRRERASLADGQRADVVARAARRDPVELLERRRTDHVQDQVELVPVVPPGEERPPVEQLGEDAAHSPDVDRLEDNTRISKLWRASRPIGAYLGVHLEREHDLRGTVPARRDVFRHERAAVVGDIGRWTSGTRETKVAELSVACGA